MAKQTVYYSIRVLYHGGSKDEPFPAISNYQYAMRRAKEVAQQIDVKGVWVVTWKPSTVRHVPA